MIEWLLICAGVAVVVYGLTAAYDRWILPLMARRLVGKILAKIQASDYVPPVKQSDFEIAVDSRGITVSRIRPTFAPVLSFSWRDVIRVTAFKRDLLTYDCICIAIAIAMADGTMTEVDEQMQGWEALTDALPKNLPGSRLWTECFSQVAFPAFATNQTVIFERNSLPADMRR